MEATRSRSVPAQNRGSRDGSQSEHASHSEKRPLDVDYPDDTSLRASPYFAMRALLDDLRPHFVDVLRTPDFRNCEAAKEIREKMELFMELYRQMTAETSSSTKHYNPFGPKGWTISKEEKRDNQSPETNPSFLRIAQNLQQAQARKAAQKYVLGGSASGWNFIIYPSHGSVYYGVTKESFQASQAELQGRGTGSLHCGETPVAYFVGGSASGWNFITSLSHGPLYCGLTKESFRASRLKGDRLSSSCR